MSNPLSFTKELWTCGWPLDDAARRIASRELLDRLEAPAPKPRYGKVVEAPQDGGLLLHILAAAGTVCHSTLPIIQHYRDCEAACAAIRGNLLARIQSGEFIAIGYMQPRNPGDLPKEIPIDVWEGKIDWINSAVLGNGLEYVAVRIVPAKRLEKLPENLAPLQIAPPPAISPELTRKSLGRPSMMKSIKLAYEELRKSGKLDFLKAQIIAIGQIRETIKAMFPDNADDDRGLGDEAIRKVICDDFRREREALKSSSKL